MTTSSEPASDDPALLREALARVDAARRGGQAFHISEALAELGRCQRRLNATIAAESSLQAALQWSRVAGSNDLVVERLCELCEAAANTADTLEAEVRGRGREAASRSHHYALEAAKLATRVADPRWEIQVLLRVSDVLDRMGQREDAVSLQSRALRLMAGEPAPDVASVPGLSGVRDS